MPKLRNTFTLKQWKGCCGKGCKKCELAQAYIAAYGKSEGLARLNEDRAVMQAKKAGKHHGKAGKKAGKSGAKAGKKKRTS